MPTAKTKEIEGFIIENVPAHSADIAQYVAESFSISRQSVNRHIRKLIANRVLREEGNTRSKKIFLLDQVLVDKTFKIIPELSEDVVFRNDIAPLIKDLALSENIIKRFQFCFTEMFNNAIDHSEGTIISVALRANPLELNCTINDNGVGIFKKIQTSFNLEDERVAILELSKGKLTSDSTKHSGEGIFFSSRISDVFYIGSHRFSLICESEDDDWLFENENTRFIEGTSVIFSFKRASLTTIKEVFDAYSNDDDYGFTVTHIPVALAKIGEEHLVSRSQAKRLLVRLNKFNKIILNFQDIPDIGQSFADEIFRVFQNEHPEIEISVVHATQEVQNMISRARSDRENQ